MEKFIRTIKESCELLTAHKTRRGRLDDTQEHMVLPDEKGRTDSVVCGYREGGVRIAAQMFYRRESLVQSNARRARDIG